MIVHSTLSISEYLVKSLLLFTCTAVDSIELKWCICKKKMHKNYLADNWNCRNHKMIPAFMVTEKRLFFNKLSL